MSGRGKPDVTRVNMGDRKAPTPVDRTQRKPKPPPAPPAKKPDVVIVFAWEQDWTCRWCAHVNNTRTHICTCAACGRDRP